VAGAPGEFGAVEAEAKAFRGRVQNLQPGRDDFRADTVTWDDGDSVG
jgi:hypothetical protein